MRGERDREGEGKDKTRSGVGAAQGIGAVNHGSDSEVVGARTPNIQHGLEGFEGALLVAASNQGRHDKD